MKPMSQVRKPAMIAKSPPEAVDVRIQRSPLLLGVSLKMYFDHKETMDWCRRVAEIARKHPAVVGGDVTLVVLPTFPAIVPAAEIFAGTRVRIGAQNLYWEDRGAFTGEVSGPYLEQIGCRYVEIGHSERRRIFAESDEIVASKVVAALRNNLIPIVCVGESERVSAAEAAGVCIRQLVSALGDTSQTGARIVAAYEPKWAIGAVRPAPVEHIAFICAAVKERLADHKLLVEGQFIYGGSAGPGLLSQIGRSVDGLFLGRFAHDPVALGGVLDEALRLGSPASNTHSRHDREG